MKFLIFSYFMISTTSQKVKEMFLNIWPFSKKIQRFPKISKSEDNQSLPKKIPRCFDHTPTNLIEVNGKYWDQKWYPHMWDNFFYLLILLPNNPLLYNEIAHRITELTNLLVHSIVRKDRKILIFTCQCILNNYHKESLAWVYNLRHIQFA